MKTFSYVYPIIILCAVTSPALGVDFLPGTVTTWGLNDVHQRDVPADLTNVMAIAAGFRHSVGLRGDGTVVAWGASDDGETRVPPYLTNVVALAVGGLHNLALRQDGNVVGWGYNIFGQTNVPPDLTGVVAVACGAYHSLALRQDGTVVGWGRNSEGQCDPPANATNLTAIAAGGNHSLALKGDGTVVAWGQEPDHAMQPPTDWTKVLAIACGNDHALALKRDRTVSSWAFSTFGSVWGQTNHPVGLSNVVAVSAGPWHSLALRADGAILAWGKNEFDEGTVPPGLTNVVALAAGTSHSLALVAQQPAWLVLEPADCAAFTGTPAALTVVASGTAPLDYQWQFAGVDLPGATNASLSWAAVQLNDSGQYRVTVSNTLGAVTSRVATLTVVESAPFILRQPQDQNVLPGCPARFEVTADGSHPISYEWRFAGGSIPGGTNAVLDLRRVDATQAGDYTVVIANAVGSATSRTATLTVRPLPTGPGSLDVTFDPTSAGKTTGIESDSIPPFVGALALQPDGKVVIGGRFDRINGIDRRGLARFNRDGTLDPSFQFVCTNDLTVVSLVQQSDQKLVFLGRRAGSGEPLLPYTGLVRLNPDGSLDTEFTNVWSGSWVPYVRCLAVQADGRILVGGEFTEPRCGIAQFSPDGSLDETFHPPPFPAYDGTGVNTLVLQPDGKILVGGDWGIGLVRLNPDGTEDTTFQPELDSGSEPLGILLLPDGHILVGQKTGCGQYGVLLRLDSDGRLDPGFAVQLDIQPLTLVRQADGRVLVAGTVSDLGRDAGIYLLRADGTIEDRFQASAHADLGLPLIAAIVLQPDGQILIGGWFSSVNQIPAEAVARLNGEILPVLRALGPSSDGFQIEWNGAAHGICWIEVSTNLRNWETVGCVTNTASGVGEFTDSAVRDNICRFYRARITPAQ